MAEPDDERTSLGTPQVASRDAIPDDIPDWIAEKIEVDNSYEVQDHEIVRAFLNTDRPFISVSYISNEVGISSNALYPRMSDLEELEIVDSCPGGGGDVYWIKDDRSDWPIPPDVEVEPVENETTVSELWEQKHIQLAVIGGLLSAAATVLLTVFLTISLAEVPFLAEVQSAFVVVAFTFALFASVAFVFSGFVFAQRRFGSDL